MAGYCLIYPDTIIYPDMIIYPDGIDCSSQTISETKVNARTGQIVHYTRTRTVEDGNKAND